MTPSQQHAIKDQDEFKPGDTVMHGRKGPFVIQSLGSQPGLFGDADMEVAFFQNGGFMATNKLKKHLNAATPPTSLGIWSDQDIQRELTLRNRASISPFDREAVQPASIDLRLGNVFFSFHNESVILDVRNPVAPLMRRIETEEIILNPSEFLLGCTVERVSLGDDVIARVEGKSSLGRIGLTIHSTAGFIDPGNKDLSITLELYNQSPHPIRLYTGMWICQIAFQDTKSPCAVPYGPERGSRYFGDHEPVPSRVKE